MRRRAQLTDDDRHRIVLAIHEAGHAVVGVMYGATTERAVLADGGTDGLCEFVADSFSPTPHAYRPLIAAAGAVAWVAFRHGPGPPERGATGRIDREELRLSSLQVFSAPLTDVLPVVLRCRSAIGVLATDLYFGREVDHGDVCAAPGLIDDGGSRQLSASDDPKRQRAGRSP